MIPNRSAELSAPDRDQFGFRLTPRAAKELSKLAERSDLPIAEVMRIAFGLVRVALNEIEAGNMIVVTTPAGRVIKEIVLPTKEVHD